MTLINRENYVRVKEALLKLLPLRYGPEWTELAEAIDTLATDGPGREVGTCKACGGNYSPCSRCNGTGREPAGREGT